MKSSKFLLNKIIKQRKERQYYQYSVNKMQTFKL